MAIAAHPSEKTYKRMEREVRARVDSMSPQQLRLLLAYLIEDGSVETLVDIDTASKRPEFADRIEK